MNLSLCLFLTSLSLIFQHFFFLIVSSPALHFPFPPFSKTFPFRSPLSSFLSSPPHLPFSTLPNTFPSVFPSPLSFPPLNVVSSLGHPHLPTSLSSLPLFVLSPLPRLPPYFPPIPSFHSSFPSSFPSLHSSLPSYRTFHMVTVQIPTREARVCGMDEWLRRTRSRWRRGEGKVEAQANRCEGR